MVSKSLAAPPGTSLTDDELSDTLGPDGDTVADKLTVALNPFRLASVSVTVPDVARGIVIEEVLVAREKSGACRTMTMTEVEWERDEEFPVMVTV